MAKIWRLYIICWITKAQNLGTSFVFPFLLHFPLLKPLLQLLAQFSSQADQETLARLAEIREECNEVLVCAASLREHLANVLKEMRATMQDPRITRLADCLRTIVHARRVTGRLMARCKGTVGMQDAGPVLEAHVAEKAKAKASAAEDFRTLVMEVKQVAWKLDADAESEGTKLSEGTMSTIDHLQLDVLSRRLTEWTDANGA